MMHAIALYSDGGRVARLEGSGVVSSRVGSGRVDLRQCSPGLGSRQQLQDEIRQAGIRGRKRNKTNWLTDQEEEEKPLIQANTVVHSIRLGGREGVGFTEICL